MCNNNKCRKKMTIKRYSARENITNLPVIETF